MSESNTHYDWPRWLKLKQAAAWSAIGKTRLKKLAVEGRIIGYQDPDSGRGDWVFDRYSLDKYRLNRISNLEQKALDLLKVR